MNDAYAYFGAQIWNILSIFEADPNLADAYKKVIGIW